MNEQNWSVKRQMMMEVHKEAKSQNSQEWEFSKKDLLYTILSYTIRNYFRNSNLWHPNHIDNNFIDIPKLPFRLLKIDKPINYNQNYKRRPHINRDWSSKSIALGKVCIYKRQAAVTLTWFFVRYTCFPYQIDTKCSLHYYSTWTKQKKVITL